MMTPADLLTVTHEHRGSSVIVRAIGEIDLFTAPILECALGAACAKASGAVVIDLSRVSFMGAAGVHLLVTTRQRCRRHGIALYLVTPNPTALVPLATVGVFGHFTFASGIDEAVEAVTAASGKPAALLQR
jgi:anti-sigma B factor antagonist